MATTTKRERGGRQPRRWGKAHPNFRQRGPDGRWASATGISKQSTVPRATSVGAGLETIQETEREGARRPFVELGATGLRHFSGILDEEFLPQLRGQRAIQVYSEMRLNDATVGAMLFAVEMLMRNVEWRMEAGSDQPADEEIAAFVDSCREDMQETWHDTLGSILSFLPYGFSVHEEVYKRREGAHPEDPTRDSAYTDGRIGWRKLPVRAQDTILRWVFDEEQGDELRGLIQMPPPHFRLRPIPERRFLLFRTTAAKGNPEGLSILRTAYRPWWFKKRIEEIEGIGVERDLAGLPKMEVPAEILDANAAPELRAMRIQIENMLRAIRRDERDGILVPREFDKEGNSRYEFDLVRSGGRRQFDTSAIVNRYDRLILSVALADFIMLGQQRVGSFALADTKTELFGFAIGAWLDSIAQVFNRKAIPRLLAINGIRTETPPKLVHGDIETIDLSEMGEYIAKLTAAGMTIFPDDAAENFLRLQAGLPEVEPDEAARREREREREEEMASLEAEVRRLEEQLQGGGGGTQPAEGGPPAVVPEGLETGEA